MVGGRSLEDLEADHDLGGDLWLTRGGRTGLVFMAVTGPNSGFSDNVWNMAEGNGTHGAGSKQ